MAQQVRIQYVDDIDGTPLDDSGERIEFSFDNKDYVIDLSDAHAEEFREAIAPYIEAGSRLTGNRKKGGRRSSGRTASSASSSSGTDTKAIREWAREAGYEVSDRGRIPADVVEAYEAAN